MYAAIRHNALNYQNKYNTIYPRLSGGSAPIWTACQTAWLNLFDQEFLYTVTAERADDGIGFAVNGLIHNRNHAFSIACYCMTV